ncbi:MAG: replication factor C large subunit [Candidatus Micrarchaeota archaeon]|nr:replication factor C large subunit [Candidatus Micrarchaeota archaeon]
MAATSGEKPTSKLVGNSDAVRSAREWAEKWSRGEAQKPLLVFGPTGIGKTFLAHALAEEFGWELLEFNASDVRDQETVERVVLHASNSSTLFGNLRLILIDDADSLSGKEDRGGAAAILRLVSSSSQPIILTAASLYSKSLSQIRPHCTPLEMRRVPASSILPLLRRMAAGSEMPQEHLGIIAQASGGDVRAAINDLKGRNMHASRDSEKNAFEVVRAILKAGSYSEARKAALLSEVEHDTLKLWIAHNIPLEYEKPFEIAEAYSCLSRADVFDGRISRQQHWGYLRYSKDLASAGVAVSKLGPYKKFKNLAYPDFLRQMGATKQPRAARLSLLRKVAAACHCSIKQASHYLPLLAELCRRNPEGAAGYFRLDEEEADFVLSLRKSRV